MTKELSNQEVLDTLNGDRKEPMPEEYAGVSDIMRGKADKVQDKTINPRIAKNALTFMEQVTVKGQNEAKALLEVTSAIAQFLD